jgi:iron complex transport system ATP-binding protein
MTPAIEITGLQYAYAKISVLNHVTFSVSNGDFYVVIGPNGSGKTTLMKIISGILKPMDGNVRIQGRIMEEYPRKQLARTIAYVPQMAKTEFPFSVKDVILMGRSPHLGLLGFERKRDMKIAEQAMGFTEVSHLADRRLGELSGGECQRVFIARAICQEPEIMLLDEPTASLDLAHQVRVMDLMERLREERSITVVMVSHDINLAAMYGNRVLLLKRGRIVEMGSPDRVITFDALENAYGCKLLVDENPLGRFPRVTPVPSRYISS